MHVMLIIICLSADIFFSFRQPPNYLLDNSERLYRDFRKFISRDLDNYYLLSFKVCRNRSTCTVTHWDILYLDLRSTSCYILLSKTPPIFLTSPFSCLLTLVSALPKCLCASFSCERVVVCRYHSLAPDGL